MKKGKFSNIVIGFISVILGLIFLSPFYLVLVNSFKSQKGIFSNVIGFPKENFTTSNYSGAFDKLDFLNSFKNSLIITVVSVIIIIIFTSMAAWILVRTKSKISTIIFLMFSASMLVPFQSVMLPLVNIAGKLHMLNRPGLIFMYLGFGAPLSIVLYHGFIKSIPKEIEESALIDGCSKFQSFWLIVFPLLKPITVTVSILNSMWIWNDFLLPQLVINRPEWQTIPLKMFYFFGQFSKRWDLALAGLIISMIPIVIFYFIMQKHIIKGVMHGSIK